MVCCGQGIHLLSLAVPFSVAIGDAGAASSPCSAGTIVAYACEFNGGATTVADEAAAALTCVLLTADAVVLNLSDSVDLNEATLNDDLDVLLASVDRYDVEARLSPPQMPMMR